MREKATTIRLLRPAGTCIALALAVSSVQACRYSNEKTQDSHEQMTMNSEPATARSILQARLTLLALRSGLPASNQVVRFSGTIVRPASEVLSEEDAAGVLAKIPKPLTCAADVAEANLVVTCGPVTHPDHVFRLESRLHALAEGEGVFGSIPDESGPVTVLILGRDESIHAPSDVVKEWAQGYVLVGPNSYGGQDPTETERKEGVAYVITIGRSEPITIEELKAMLRRDRVAGSDSSGAGL